MKPCLLLTTDFPPRHGGVAYYLDHLMRYFKEDVVVIAPFESGDWKHDQSVNYKIERTSLYYRFFWPHWFRSLFLLIRKRSLYDIVVISHILPLGTAAWIAYTFTRKPYILILHGFDFSLATRSIWRSWLTRHILRNAKLVVTNSQFLLCEVQSHSVIKQGIVIYPSLPLKTIPTHSFLGKNTSIIHLLTISRLVRRKGHRRVLEALSLLKKQGKGDRLFYTIAGEGPERPFLEQWVKDFDLETCVRIISLANDQEKDHCYQQTDLFVMPTIVDPVDREGFGIVYLEAAQFGIPSIGTRQPGVDEAIVDGQTGLLVEDGNISALAQAIYLLAEDETRRKNLGQNAKKRVEKEFTPEEQYGKLKHFL